MKIKDHLRIQGSLKISKSDAFSNNSKINRIWIESQNDYAILKKIFKRKIRNEPKFKEPRRKIRKLISSK